MITFADMSLDDAKDFFDASPSDSVAGAYLEIAAQYARDEMIEPDEALSIMARVGEWLRHDVEEF